MKKVINGKLYDTETAKKIAEWCSSCARNDFYFFEEELYQKKTGEFFLYGSGNAASPYSEYSYGSHTGSEKIVPICYEEAREWAEKRLDADEYIKFFGEPEENGNNEKQTLNLYLPSNIVEKVKRGASKEGIPVSECISRLIEQEFN